MTESVSDPLVTSALTPAFGLAPDVLDCIDRASERWHKFLLPNVPPADLAHLHRPYLFALLWERLLTVVRCPTQVLCSGQSKYINVVGSCVVEVKLDGTMQAYCWTCETLGKPRLTPLDEWKVALQGMPYQDIWMRLLSRLAALEVQRDAQVRGVEVSFEQDVRYAQWAFGVYWRQLKRHADLRHMRRTVARTLGFEAALIPAAGRIPRTTMNRRLVLLGAYNRVVRHRAAFESLRREAPHLLPVFGALCDDDHFPALGEALERLKRFVTSELNFPPRVWRMLVKSGPRLLQPLTRYYRDDPGEATIEHLRLVAVLDLREVPPTWVVNALLGIWGDIANRWPSYFSDVLAGAATWRHLIKLLMGQQPTAAVLTEFDLVQRWLKRNDAVNGLTRHQRAGGWPYLVRKASAWAEEHAREQMARDESWPVPFDKAQRGDLEITPLRSAFELWQEALAMRHCVDRYVERCMSGRCLIASVQSGGKRIATVQFETEDRHWRLVQLKGFANSEVAPEIAERVKRLAFELELPPRPIELDEQSSDIDIDPETEVDQDSLDDALKDEVVAAILDDAKGPEAGTLYGRVAAWLGRLNDTGDLNYDMGGRIVLEHQLDDWQLDLDTWLTQAHESGILDDDRYQELVDADDAQRQLRPEETAQIRECFVDQVLSSENTDEDVYGVWGAQEISATAGRSVWALYRITGYSFTYVEFSLLVALAP